jgi:hypothetical protein
MGAAIGVAAALTAVGLAALGQRCRARGRPGRRQDGSPSTLLGPGTGA